MIRKISRKLLRDYPLSVVRAGFLRWWLDRNCHANAHLAKEGPTARFLDVTEPKEHSEIATALGRASSRPTLKDVEAAFEQLMDAARRRKQGAIYTPDHIIDYLVTEALRETPGSHPVLLDPACGSGGFLARGAVHLSEQLGIPLSSALMKHIAGVDNDEDAVEHASCLLELHAADRCESINCADLHLVCMDALLTPPRQLLTAVGFPQGAHVVATNPPYVKLQTLSAEYRKKLAGRYPHVSRYNFSLALLFLVAGRELIRPDGTLAYITQNNLFTSLAGESVRELLQEAQSIRRIVDFGHHRVFKGVLAYTCLIFADRKEHPTIEFERVERDVTLEELRSLDFGAVPTGSLKPKKWRLAKPEHLRNLRQIESVGEPLGHVAEIKVGFATLKDKAYFVSGPTLPCVAVHPETGREFPIEPTVTREAIRVADVREERELDSVTRRIVFPYKRLAGAFVLLPEDELRSRFPLAYRYLCECRSLLESRDKGKRSYEAWYAWGRTQGREAPGPKLLTKTFSSRPQFFYDPSSRLFCNGYSVRVKSSTLFGPAISLEALKVILESRVMRYYAKLTSFQIGGDFQCYQKNFMERFGIPLVSQKQQQHLTDTDRSTADSLLLRTYGLSPEAVDEMLGPADCGGSAQAVPSQVLVN